MTDDPAQPVPHGGGAPASDKKTLSIISLILAILSLVFGQTIVVPIIAIILGFVARSREPAGRTIALWAIILSFIALFGWILLGLLGIIVIAPFLL